MKTVIPIKQVTSQPPVDDGWRPLSTLSEPRLSEMAENYRALGYEEIGQVFGTLYVRKRNDAPANHELFD